MREGKDRTGKIFRPVEKATDVRNNWPDTQPCMHLYSMNPTPPLCTTQSCCCCCCRRCWFLIAIVARKRSEGEGCFFSLLGCARVPPPPPPSFVFSPFDLCASVPLTIRWWRESDETMTVQTSSSLPPLLRYRDRQQISPADIDSTTQKPVGRRRRRDSPIPPFCTLLTSLICLRL